MNYRKDTRTNNERISQPGCESTGDLSAKPIGYGLQETEARFAYTRKQKVVPFSINRNACEDQIPTRNPCFRSCFEIVLVLPESTIDKPCENLIKSIPPGTWHRFASSGGSV